MLPLRHMFSRCGDLRWHTPEAYLLSGMHPVISIVVDLVLLAVPGQRYEIMVAGLMPVVVELVVGLAEFLFCRNLAIAHSLEIFVGIPTFNG